MRCVHAAFEYVFMNMQVYVHVREIASMLLVRMLYATAVYILHSQMVMCAVNMARQCMFIICNSQLDLFRTLIIMLTMEGTQGIKAIKYDMYGMDITHGTRVYHFLSNRTIDALFCFARKQFIIYKYLEYISIYYIMYIFIVKIIRACGTHSAEYKCDREFIYTYY